MEASLASRQTGNAPPGKNPFATRYWGPGRLPLWLPPGESLSGLVDRLAQQHFTGQIVGPHGSGKSTLLWHLRQHLACSRGAQCLAIKRPGRRGATCWKLRLPHPSGRGRKSLWLVDGWEQLPEGWKLRLRLGRWYGHGLVLTTHTPTGLPTLAKTQATAALLEHLLAHLDKQAQRLLRPGETLPGLLQRHGGNLREVLFDLYDRYELLAQGC